MSSPMYVVLMVTEDDDDIEMETVAEDELIKRLSDPEGDYYGLNILREVPHGETWNWPNGLLILDAEVVIPKPTTVVTKYVMDERREVR